MRAMMISRRSLLGSALTLRLLDLARAEPAGDGFLALEAAPGSLRLLPEPAAETPVFAYNGVVPGPLIRCKKGETLKIRLVNRLAQPTSLSWSGLRIVNAMDGVGGLTQPPVAPGESFDYRFTPPDSGLFWYRPNVQPFTAEQLGRGLYGALIVDEPAPPQADRDMLAIIADWRLDAKGEIVADFDSREDATGAGRIGALVTVNSQPIPATHNFPPATRMRLRLLSAVNARIMSIAFEGVTPYVLAVDGQPADSAFEPVNRTIPVGPGARFDIIFDLPREADAEARLILRGGGEKDQPLLVLKTQGKAQPDPPPIASLDVNPTLPRMIKLQAAKRVEIVIEAAKAPPTPATGERPAYWTINGGVTRFSDKPLFEVKRGSPVTLAIVNRSGFAQDIHVRGHSMRLLHDLDDGWEPYWRDTVLVAAGKTKHLAFVADNPGKWAIESFIAERQTSGLSTWFLVK